MRRRDLIKGVVGSAVAWPLAARAQQAAMPVIGFLHPASAKVDGFAPQFSAFHQGLGELGFEEGRNLSIEYRWAEGHYERLPAQRCGDRRLGYSSPLADMAYPSPRASRDIASLVIWGCHKVAA
jgi:hypothetical protein